MKRSNRLILLIGFFLAAVAFVGIILILQGNSGGAGPSAPPTTATIVVAARDISLGTKLQAADLTTTSVPILSKPTDSYDLVTTVIGQTVRTDVTSGQYISTAVFSAASAAANIGKTLTPGKVAIAVQVDQVTGVGTLIQPGDHVDVVLALTQADAKNPIVVEKAPTKEGQPPATVRNFAVVNPLLNSTTVKVLVQNARVLGTLLPPPTTTPTTGQPQTQAQGSSGSPSLNGQNQIVFIEVTPQQAELVRFTQIDGNLSLVLRSPQDDTAADVVTTGITVRQLVDKYGVLPPKIILTEQP